MGEPLGACEPLIAAGLCGPTGVPGAVGPGRPRDRHTRACGSEWSISKPARALRSLRRPPHQWRLGAGVWLGASSRSPARPRRLRGGLQSGGSWCACACSGPAAAHRHRGLAPQAPRRPPIGRVLVRVCLLWPCRRPPAPRPGPSIVQDSHPVVTSHIPELTPNFACNSPTTLSNLEIKSLELQRFQTLLKLHLIELHASFLRGVRIDACWCRSACPQTMRAVV